MHVCKLTDHLKDWTNRNKWVNILNGCFENSDYRVIIKIQVPFPINFNNINIGYINESSRSTYNESNSKLFVQDIMNFSNNSTM